MDANLQAHKEMKRFVSEAYHNAIDALGAKVDEIYSNIRQAWINNGGCVTCNGTGTILTWSTLDGSGYDEHGKCPNCTEESKAVGASPLVYGPARSNGAHIISKNTVVKNLASDKVADLLQNADIATANYNLCCRKPSNRGDYVIVTKGRKVVIGTHGAIVGFSQNAYGFKAGFIDGNSTVHWTAISNLELCLGMDGATKKSALEAYIANDNSYRAKKGLKLNNFDLEKMMAS
jgi:hypothetical protein